MKTYSYYRKQLLNVSIEEAWDFFSSPLNLAKITPGHLNFKIISGFEKGSIGNGDLITYNVSPLLNIPITWVTQIDHVRAPYTFSDIQLKGPYKKWEHIHTFRKSGSSVEMTDSIKYSLPLGLAGDIAHTLFVKKKIERIFDYRFEMLEKLFNNTNK